jgi:tetratricopeptide (TPR) repeat protein
MNGTSETSGEQSISATRSSLRAFEDRLELHMLDGDHESALVEIERGLARFPASSSLWTQRGRLCARIGRHAEAEAAYEAAAVIDPGNAEATDYFVGRARARGDHLAAVDWLGRRLQRYRDDAQTYARRAMALRCLDRRKAAAVDAATALVCLPAADRDALETPLQAALAEELARGEDREHEIVAAVCERLSRMQLGGPAIGARVSELIGLVRALGPR